MPALLISFGAQPLPLSLEASGYYDTDGNWVEDYNYYAPAYDPSYSTGGYYDEFGNWISDGSGYGDTGSTGSSYDIWLSASSEIDTDNDGISDYDEVYGYSIETESYYEVPYSFEEYDSETGEYVWRDSSYTSTTYNSIWVTTNPTDPDTDGDGLPDGWERLFSFHPNDLTDGYEDDDSDGLRNGLEYSLGTDLWNNDSDEDDFTDGEEVLFFGTDPMNPDDPGTTPLTNSGPGSGGGGSGGTGSGGTDSGTGGTDNGGTSTGGGGLTPDWLTWQGEHFADLLATNPDDPDAGGDGDPDNDELTNIEEFLLATDPRNPDTDGDDLVDGWEVAGLVLHFDRTETPAPAAAPLPGESGFSGLVYGPYQFQTSSTLYADDALSEIGIVEIWIRTVETHDEIWGITATTQETMERTGLYNAEGTLVFPDDGWVENANGELVTPSPAPAAPPEPTWTQYFDHELQMWVGTYANGSTVSTWWWVHTDPLNGDSDGDDTPDGWEYENWFNPKKASDAAEDPDDDTLSNLLEYLNGTDPWLGDTDGDSLSDSHELNVTLTDPLDPGDPGGDSGVTTPIGGGITTVTRYQAFGGGGGSSSGAAGGGSVLTMGGGGLLLGSQQLGLGNSLQPGNGGQKQTEQPTSEDELYLGVRRVNLSYGPTGDDALVSGGDDGAYDGYWNEVTDPVTDEMVLREWISTGGGTDGTNGTTSDEPTEYAARSSHRIDGQVQQSESEPSSTTSPAITFLEKREMESPIDWDSDVAYPAPSGHGVSFTSLKEKENPKQENRGSGELVEVRLARKTAPNGTHLAVEREVEKTFLKVFKHRPAPFDEADEWTIDKVEVVKLKIQEGDSTSVEDKENPVPEAVLKPEIVEGKVTGVSLLPVEVVEIGFSGEDAYYQLQSDPEQLKGGGSTAYDAPHWKDGNEDGQMTPGQNGDELKPLVLVAKSNPEIEARFKIAGIPDNVDVSISATGHGLTIPSTPLVKEEGGFFKLPKTASSTPLDDAIAVFDGNDEGKSFKLKWKIKVGNTQEADFKTTHHTAYVVKAKPSQGVLASETIFYHACKRPADAGHTSTTPDEEIVRKIYEEFETRSVQRMKPGKPEEDGTDLVYWKTNAPEMSLSGLLQNGDGNCGAFMLFFLNCLGGHGIVGNTHEVTSLHASPNTLDGPTVPFDLRQVSGNAVMLIKEHDFNHPASNPQPTIPGFTFDRNEVALTNPADGQGTQSPKSTSFENHWVATHNGVIYDPSYGTPPKNSINEWENSSIDGYGIIILTQDQAGNIYVHRRYKENDPNEVEVQFQPNP